ncbi:MAG TPA: hypothetical protein VHM26_12540, partial [Chitinophagaceae bacterium]|nr:hypothetical protein [Chitinophagaceae bacterium]
PSQEKLYLRSDYELMEKWATTFRNWFLGILIVVIIFFMLKETRSIKKAGGSIFPVIVLLAPLFFVLTALVLPAILLLNRIDLGKSVEQKYIVTVFAGMYNEKPQIIDYRSKEHLDDKKIKHIEKLDSFNVGDTVVLTFNKGLLGVGFNPRVK